MRFSWNFEGSSEIHWTARDSILSTLGNFKFYAQIFDESGQISFANPFISVPTCCQNLGKISPAVSEISRGQISLRTDVRTFASPPKISKSSSTWTLDRSCFVTCQIGVSNIWPVYLLCSGSQLCIYLLHSRGSNAGTLFFKNLATQSCSIPTNVRFDTAKPGKALESCAPLLRCVFYNRMKIFGMRGS